VDEPRVDVRLSCLRGCAWGPSVRTSPKCSSTCRNTCGPVQWRELRADRAGRRAFASHRARYGRGPACWRTCWCPLGGIGYHPERRYTPVASDEHHISVPLVHRPGETLHQLLGRLANAVGPAVEDPVFTDEINEANSTRDPRAEKAGRCLWQPPTPVLRHRSGVRLPSRAEVADAGEHRYRAHQSG